MEGNDEKDKTVESTSTNVLANEKEKDENDNVDVVRKLSVSSALSHESVCNVDVERKLSVSSALSQESGCNVDVDRKLSVSSALSHESVCNAFSRAADTSDMRLIVDGKPLYVSRLVLSIISPVFKDIFEKRARELSIFEIPLPGRKYEEMLEFLYCVYPDSLKPISGKIPVTMCSSSLLEWIYHINYWLNMYISFDGLFLKTNYTLPSSIVVRCGTVDLMLLLFGDNNTIKGKKDTVRS